jgi:hypothetical protein
MASETLSYCSLVLQNAYDPVFCHISEKPIKPMLFLSRFATLRALVESYK